MAAHACPTCGAPLPIAEPGQVERCAYCGGETREDFVAQSTVSAARRAGRPAWVIALAWSGALAGFALVVWGGAFAVDSCKRPSTPRLTRASLATTPLDQWQPLDAPGMIGKYASFDAVANLDWARAIGTSWKADAILTNVRVSRVAKDGTVNLAVTPDADVRYEFVSPKCVADYKSATSVVATKNACALRIGLSSQHGAPGVQVMSASTSAQEHTYEVQGLTCTMGQAFALLEGTGNLPPQPVYDATLQGTSGGHLTWSFHTISSGKAPIHAVDATTCTIAW